jgi:glycosyltransferase involved in cell wall biosynthesis
MGVLVFYPSNTRTVAMETMILAIHRAGIEIELLTTCEEGPLHDYLRLHGIRAYAHPVPRRPAILYYPRQGIHLIRFCRQHRTSVVLSHLQESNIIAVWARFVSRSRIVPFRHHFAFVDGDNQRVFQPDRTERLFDRVITRLSKTVIVPSQAVADGIHAVEGVAIERLKVVRYIYDFDQYERPDADAVERIRARYPARLTLLMASRLVPLKRPDLAFAAVRDLVNEGLDVRLLVLGDGPQRESLEAFVAGHGLGERIVMLGHRSDVVNYMAAADVLVHPSLTEASCSAVKEMALLGKPAIVCQGVGDFDDYVQDGLNGFVMPRLAGPDDLAEIIRIAYETPDRLGRLGAALRETVLELFGVRDERVREYLALLR